MTSEYVSVPVRIGTLDWAMRTIRDIMNGPPTRLRSALEGHLPWDGPDWEMPESGDDLVEAMAGTLAYLHAREVHEIAGDPDKAENPATRPVSDLDAPPARVERL